MTLTEGSTEMQMPTEWEQSVAEIYVNEHILDRPDTNIKTILVFTATFISAAGLLTRLIHDCLLNAGVAASVHPCVSAFYHKHPWVSMTILFTAIIAAGLFFVSKYAVIGIVKFYQHYAPEEIRRRCLFMPTCSEYTIMAVRKYGCIIGMYKGLYRLMYRCKGNIYSIDYP